MSSTDDPSPLDKRRNFQSISRQKFDEEGHPTNSSIEQINVEDACLRFLLLFLNCLAKV